MLATHARGIPMVLINGRLSAASYARWRWGAGLVRPVLGAFATCFAQDEVQAERLLRLGVRDIAMIGDSLEQDVIAPRRAGIFSVWFNEDNKQGAPSFDVPTITALSELVPLLRDREASSADDADGCR